MEDPVYTEASYADLRKKKPKNPLLVRPETGKTRAHTQKLPPPDHVYGMVESKDAEGAKEVIHQWQDHVPNAARKPGKDFVKSNKTAVLGGATTAKDIKEFRAEKTVLKRQVKGKQTRPSRPKTPPGGFGGAKPLPPESIADLMTNKHARQAITKTHEQIGAEKQKKKEKLAVKKKQKALGQPTKASTGHQKVLVKNEKAPFKMKKFQKVESKVAVQLKLDEERFQEKLKIKEEEEAPKE